MNDDGQDAAVHHLEKKTYLLNRGKLKLNHRSKTEGSAEAYVQILGLRAYVSESLHISAKW
jgi:hypothetical protein